MSLVMRRPTRREKFFGHRTGQRLDRNAKARLMHRARQLAKPVQKGRHYGAITGKDVDVLAALAWIEHAGRCYPSYATIAKQAGCSRSHVAPALARLEAAGLLTWVHGLVRQKETHFDMFGQGASRWRVVRTSNSYQLIDPANTGKAAYPCESKFPAGSLKGNLNQQTEPLSGPLSDALKRFAEAIGTGSTSNRAKTTTDTPA